MIADNQSRISKLFFSILLFFVVCGQKSINAHIRTLTNCAQKAAQKCKRIACEKALPTPVKPPSTVPLTDDWHSASVQYFFSPDDHLQEKLLTLIARETVSIKAAVYLITDTKIAKALIKAKERNIDVQLIVDASQSRSIFSKTASLKKEGIQIFEYEAHNELYNLMHNKFAIFKKQNLVWTGSYNWTKAADEKNQENAVLIKSPKAVARYLAQFDVIKTRCRSN